MTLLKILCGLFITFGGEKAEPSDSTKSYAAAWAKAKNEHVDLLVLVTGPGCTACVKVHTQTLPVPTVKKRLAAIAFCEINWGDDEELSLEVTKNRRVIPFWARWHFDGKDWWCMRQAGYMSPQELEEFLDAKLPAAE